jgi:hypothetical protein
MGVSGTLQIWGVQNGEMQCELVDTGATSISGAGTDRVGNGHLSADYACMTWGPLLSVSSAKKVLSHFLQQVQILCVQLIDHSSVDLCEGKMHMLQELLLNDKKDL